MFSRGADENKKWILAVQKLILEENQTDEQEDDEEDDEEQESSYDIYEKIRSILNKELKDPDNDKEIEKILKKTFNELKRYFRSDEDEEEEEEKKQQQAQQPAQAQFQPQIPQAPNIPNQDQQNQQGMGAPGYDLSTAAGIGMQPSPASGGQM